MDTKSIIDLALTAVGGIVAGIVFMRGGLGGATIKLMKENKQAQDQAIKRLEEDAKDKAGQIANLSGQVQMLKDIPLAQIAKNLEVVAKSHLDVQHFLKDHEEQAMKLSDVIADKAAEKVIQFIQEHNQNG